MFGSSILEVAIGIIFIYLLLSLICSAINELIASIMNMRGEKLFEGIKNLLNDPTFTGLAQALYHHGLIDGISQTSQNPNKPNRRPSYMASKTFALALTDILGSKRAGQSLKDMATRRETDLAVAKARFDANPRDPGIQKTYYDAQHALVKAREILTKVDEVRLAYDDAECAARKVSSPKDSGNLKIAKEKFEKALSMGRLLAAELPDPLENIQRAVFDIPNGHTRESLSVLIENTKKAAILLNQAGSAAHQMQILQDNIEQWFNDAMDRVSGWYKRWTQKIILGIAVIVVAATNMDTIMHIERLYGDLTLRAAVVAVANDAVQGTTGDPTKDKAARDNLLREAGELSLPLGWIPDPQDPYKTKQVPSCRGIPRLECFANWGLKLLGLLITVIATQQGSPFWFDLLGKVTNLRASGIRPEEPKRSEPQPAKN
jgi:hypothetical protein